MPSPHLSPVAWISAYFVHSGYRCIECTYCHDWKEHHGPGLDEPMSECLLLEGVHFDPIDCPAYADHLEDDHADL